MRMRIALDDTRRVAFQVTLKVLAGLTAGMLLIGIGYGIGQADKCTEWYTAGIADSKLQIREAAKDGIPFYFGPIRMVPRADGAVNVRIAGAGADTPISAARKTRSKNYE